MNFTVGVYDLFGYAIPGAAYLSLGGYLADRADVWDWEVAGGFPTLLALVVLCYVVGQITYVLGGMVTELIPRRGRRSRELARDEFVQRNHKLRNRSFVKADLSLLQAAVEMASPQVAGEISRLRAAGIMLRNVAPALAVASVVAAVEVVVGSKSTLGALVGTAVFALASIAAVSGSRRLSKWSHTKTLELAANVPNIDAIASGDAPTAG